MPAVTRCVDCGGKIGLQRLKAGETRCERCDAQYQLKQRAASAGVPAETLPELVTPRLKTAIPDFVWQALHPTEQVFGAFKASLLDHHRPGEFRHDKFVLTNERIIYYHTSLVHKGMGELPYKAITGVSFNKGFAHGKVIVDTAMAGLTMQGIGNEDATFAERLISGHVAGRRFTTPDASAEQSAMPAREEPEGPSSAAGEEPTARLARAKSMLDAGLITEADFEEVKRRVLSEL